MIARALSGVCVAVTAMAAVSAYQSEIAAWHAQREAALKAENGWLSLAGLFWLHEGANPFGMDGSNQIVLPDGPPKAGVFDLHQGKVTVTTNGSTRALVPDSADVVKAGRLNLFVIQRGGRFGIRLKDPQSQARREFHGIQSFPASEAWRVTAKFVPEARKIPILNVLGQTEPSDSPGYAEFRLAGRELRLRPIIEEPGDRQLFFIFRDQTSGKETYGAGRFLYTDLPKEGQVVLDFNKAYNPPCAFTPYATCPLPPPENRLAIRIEAGEKKYGH
ncbi:MAG TPA: DUF1684 domain-containing protein [Bryobacteraceae bacterium]|nr:DUF1684 domain-containing protein [Bryobacteraceae bacterium]